MGLRNQLIIDQFANHSGNTVFGFSDSGSPTLIALSGLTGSSIGGGTVTGATNIGLGHGLYSGMTSTPGALKFKTLSKGSFIRLVPTTSDITISATGLTSSSLFNSYTGTTAPGTYQSKSSIITLTGTTLPATYETISNVNALVTMNTVVVSGGVMALNFNSKYQKRFECTSGITGNFTVTFTGTSNIAVFTVDLLITGTIAITMPSSVVMLQTDTRWNNATKILTLVGGTAEPFELSFTKSGSIYKLKATDRYYAS